MPLASPSTSMNKESYFVKTCKEVSPNALFTYNARRNEQFYCNATTMLSYTCFIQILGPSFTTIAAFGSNGAIIHYTPTQDTDAKINSSGLFLGISKFENLIYGGLPCPKV